MEDSKESQQFQVLRYYIKDIQCKVPHSPTIFIENSKEKDHKPETSIEIQAKHYPISKEIFEVVMHLHAATKFGSQTAFILDIQQAGIFKCQLDKATPAQVEELVKFYCPSLLYPYLSQAAAEASIKAGFPPIILTPINFSPAAAEENKVEMKENSPAEIISAQTN